MTFYQKIKQEYKQENKKVLWKEVLSNFCVGFFSWLSVGFAALYLEDNSTWKIFILYAFCNLIQRHFDAHMISRATYTTILGKKIVFPKGLWLGSLSGIYLIKILL